MDQSKQPAFIPPSPLTPCVQIHAIITSQPTLTPLLNNTVTVYEHHTPLWKHVASNSSVCSLFCDA